MSVDEDNLIDAQQRFDRERLKRQIGTGQPVMNPARSVQIRDIEHLWPGVLYLGKPTLLVGDPGLGKSLLTADIAARCSSGRPWPLGTVNATPGDVLLCSAEDDPSDTIVPRLIAAGADLDRIDFLEAVREYDEASGEKLVALSLDRHVGMLEQIAKAKQGRLRLVVIDPVAAFLGATDSHKNAEIRSLLGALARIASQYRFSVLVVSHLTKGSQTSAVYRISGSLAFVAAARAAYAVVRDPEDPLRRLVLPVKNNLASDLGGFSYAIGVADNDAPYVQWGDEAVTSQTAESILGIGTHSATAAVSERVLEICAWLKEELQHEAQPAASMWRRAEEREFSERDVKRAKKELGITSQSKGFQDRWHWCLPK